MPLVLDRTVTADDPYDRLILVAAADPFAVNASILRRENLGAFAPFFVHLVAPSRQQSDVDAESGCASYDKVHVSEIFIARLRRIVINQWRLPFAIGFA